MNESFHILFCLKILYKKASLKPKPRFVSKPALREENSKQCLWWRLRHDNGIHIKGNICYTRTQKAWNENGRKTFLLSLRFKRNAIHLSRVVASNKTKKWIHGNKEITVEIATRTRKERRQRSEEDGIVLNRTLIASNFIQIFSRHLAFQLTGTQRRTIFTFLSFIFTFSFSSLTIQFFISAKLEHGGDANREKCRKNCCE